MYSQLRIDPNLRTQLQAHLPGCRLLSGGLLALADGPDLDFRGSRVVVHGERPVVSFTSEAECVGWSFLGSAGVFGTERGSMCRQGWEAGESSQNS